MLKHLILILIINVIIILDSPIESSLTCHSSSLEPGNMVYMTAFVNLNEMYIRKLEDYNDDFNNFLDKVDQYCSSGKYNYYNSIYR